MRPIKFRVWDKEDSLMIYGLKDMAELFDGDFDNFLNGDYVMQFTGLLDKNDKEVWEGDIVEFVDMKGHWTTIRKEVKWSDEVAGFFPNFGDGYMEVIGNVYENPELIGD